VSLHADRRASFTTSGSMAAAVPLLMHKHQDESALQLVAAIHTASEKQVLVSVVL
jgi:hypothetical protein